MPLQERVRLNRTVRQKIAKLLRQFYEHFRDQTIPTRVTDFLNRRDQSERRSDEGPPPASKQRSRH
jgi:hypothetical protein